MLIPLEFLTKKRGLLNPADYEVSFEHAEFTERLRKTFYYGKAPNTDRPSLPVTELTVGFFTDAAPRQLGRVDLSLASDMSRQACISPCSMMLGLIYVDRLKHRNPGYLQQVSSSDLFLVSMMMASKYLYDEGVDEEVFNDEWAESADMDVDDVNALERAFLKAIDWQLYVRQAEFFALLQRIERKVAWDKGRERGFYSYSDLVVLSGEDSVNQALCAILQQVCKVMVVCSVAYVAGVLTMVASTMSLVCLQQSLAAQPSLLGYPFNTMTTSYLPSPPMSQPVPDTKSTSWNVDSNGSVDNGDQHWQSTEEPATAKPGLAVIETLGMSGLFTLAFLKDTLVQFVTAMTPGSLGSDKSLGTLNAGDMFTNGAYQDDTEQDVVCTCGCCSGPVGWMQYCVNVSMDHGKEIRWHRYGTGNKQHGTANRRHVIGDTQGTTGNARYTTGLSGSATNCDQAVAAQCCCRSIRRQWTVGDLGTKFHVDIPFHNVVLGFGTTAEAVVAG